MIEDLRDLLLTRLGRAKDMLERASAGPALVRFAILVVTGAAFGLALPRDALLQPSLLGGVVLLAALTALLPRTRMAGLTLLLIAAAWLGGSYAYAQAISVPRLIGLGAAMYLVHSLAALAAALPYDAVVSPGVIVSWLLRAAGIVSAGAIVSVLLLAVVKLVVGPVFLVASVVGVLAAGALAWLIARRA